MKAKRRFNIWLWVLLCVPCLLASCDQQPIFCCQIIYHITHLFFIVKVRNYFQLQDKYPPQSQIIHSNRNSLQKIQEVCQQDKYGCQ